MTPAADVFALLRGALEAAGIRYAIGGSWASTAFGEPRFTNDVDILADFTLEMSLVSWAIFPQHSLPIRRKSAERFVPAGRST
jgi:hypothetical protein